MTCEAAPTTLTKVLAIVPALNEEGSVGAVVRKLHDAGYDCVVVDDGSTDATGKEAAKAGAAVLRLPFNLGVGGALRCGFRYAVEHDYEAVVQCDADGQHPPDEIARLLEAQRVTGAHLVVGSRFMDGAPVYPVGRVRRFVMRCLSRIVRITTGVVMHDTTSGFRCISSPLLGEFAASYPVHYLGDTFEAAIVAARAGYKVVETPIEITARQAGQPSAKPLTALSFLVRAVVASISGLNFRIRKLDDVPVAAEPRVP